MLKQSAQRFNFLLLDEGEYYFEDFSCFLQPPEGDGRRLTAKRIKGRLKLCSKSVLFDPEEQQYPVMKWPFAKVTSIEPAPSQGESFVFTVESTIEMLQHSVIKPYDFSKGKAVYTLSLVYGTLSTFLPKVTNLLEISRLRLDAGERKLRGMIEEREATFKFDPAWIEELSEIRERELTGSRLTPLVHNPGRILITNRRLYFQPFNNISVEPVSSYPRDSIVRVVPRRHALRHIGLEVFWKDGSSVLFAFKTGEDRDSAFEALKAGDSAVEGEENMLLKWQSRLVSNFDYLMYLNSQADRTLNDLTQYPVFPWVIADYTSEDLDLSDPATFRDLSKPIGALNEERLAHFKARYREMPGKEEGGPPKFLYGTHYSTPGYVLYYLVRDEPELMLRLQNGRFDAADRLFDSVADSWTSVLTNPADVKELIPEFYQRGRGRFLKNYKNLDLGVKQNGRPVMDVALPPWAADADDFIAKCADALESEYVSRNLHHWIDLIFGYKQRGQAAVDADNVFFHLTYEGAVDVEKMEDPVERSAIEAQIREFGQTPKQLFTAPHPARRREGDVLDMSSGVATPGTPSSVLDLFNERSEAGSVGGGGGGGGSGAATPVAEGLEPLEVDLNMSGRSLGRPSHLWPSFTNYSMHTSLKLHKDAVMDICLSSDGRTMYTVSQDACLKLYSFAEEKQLRSINVCRLALSSCTLTPDEKNVVVGSWDNNVYIYSVEYGRVLETLTSHDSSVSSLTTVARDGATVLFSSSWDSTCKLWSVDPLDPLPIGELDGEHETEVVCAAVSADGTRVASGGADGMVVVWDITDASCPDVTASIPAHPGGVHSVAITPDGSSVVSVGADKCLKVHDSRGGEVLCVPCDQELRCVATDGLLVLAGGDGGVLRAWELASGSETPCDFGPASTETITRLLVTDGGATVITGRQNGAVVIFKKEEKSSKERQLEDQFLAGLNTP